ncbi:MAG: lipopolysaccharide biosynthesis protein RfbH [Carboxylicivirga sp.]|jgi:CDP-6-deoxy-D-xylo-4-hexulose-3-dehydrase|nr:lipopolysaccharide biosynthesis protein RfbH [Carboxylicivirga sp.]
MNKDNLRKRILELVSEYYSEQQEESFIAGRSTIPFAGRVYDSEEMVNLVDSSLDFWLTTGRYAEDFEVQFAKIMQQRYCMLVNSGSSANLLAVSALFSPLLKNKRILPGDEIITVAAGFPTTVTPIIQNGAVPVFVDVDLETYNIRPELIEEAITKKTKAIVLAHTLGNPFNLREIRAVCDKYELFLVEDCCDAVGSEYDGKMVGTFGDIATTSFYPAHHITMGEGGAVLTSNPVLKRIVTSLRDWGRDCYCDPGCDNTCGRRFKGQYGDLPKGYDHKYVYSHLGYNLKVTDMQAAIGVAQLKKLPEFIEKRRKNFGRLKEGLNKYSEYLILPKATKHSDPSWFGFPFTVKEDSPFTRNELAEHLEAGKILTRQLFAGNMTRQPAFKDVNYRIVGSLENTDLIMMNTIFIGVYPGITKKKVEYILEVFAQFFNALKKK